jgi:hypothetical protein
VKKLDEEAVEECLNVDSDAPVVLKLKDSEMIHILMHPSKSVDTDDEVDKRLKSLKTVLLTSDDSGSQCSISSTF